MERRPGRVEIRQPAKQRRRIRLGRKLHDDYLVIEQAWPIEVRHAEAGRQQRDRDQGPRAATGSSPDLRPPSPSASRAILEWVRFLIAPTNLTG